MVTRMILVVGGGVGCSYQVVDQEVVVTDYQVGRTVRWDIFV